MSNTKVVRVTISSIEFEDGSILESQHEQDCCESHELSFEHLSLKDFEGLEFDLSTDEFFEKVEGYGIRLKPVNNFPVSVPGYGSNNGYYSSELTLVLTNGSGEPKTFDISECQVITD